MLALFALPVTEMFALGVAVGYRWAKGAEL